MSGADGCPGDRSRRRSGRPLREARRAAEDDVIHKQVQLFEALYLARRLPAWSGSATKRLAKTPKLFFADTGLMAHLLQLTPERLRTTPTLLGPLLENFVVMEIHK